MAGLRELWRDAIPDAGALADDLVARYGEKRRTAYRDRYLIGVLHALDSLEQLCTDPVAVRLAAWFHRAAHSRANPVRDDAEASALLAEQLLPTYGVNSVRIAEVVRLIRLTGGEPQEANQNDSANGDVLLDAVHAVLADSAYPTHASEVRRDSRIDTGVRREQIQAMLASQRIYRTELAHEQYEDAARANLAAELELLEQLTPSVWKGWQRTGLSVLAVLTAFVGWVAAAASIAQPWRVPAFKGDAKWQAILMAVLAAGAVAAIWWAVRRTGSTARTVIAVPAAVGLVTAIVVVFTVPPTTGVAGVGQRVPLLMITSVLLVLASAAAYGATKATAGVTRNRGQVLAGLGALVVVVLATLLVIDPIQRAYLFSANEYLDDSQLAADMDVASVVNGETLWTHPSRPESGVVLGTAHGIAIARGRGTVEMVDPGTGKTRWRYIRADTDDEAHLYLLDGGQQLLVEYDDLGHVVLDTQTGKRTAVWPDAARDYDIQNEDPLVTGKTVSKGSDKLYGTNIDGTNRWKYEPGRCTGISATATDDIAVVGLSHSCGNTPDQLVGLDLKNGKRRWIRDGSLSNLMAVGDLVVGVDSEGRKSRKLTAIDAHSGELRWAFDLPSDRACSVQLEPAADRIVLLSCPSDAERATATLVQFVDLADGRVVSTAKASISGGTRYAVTPSGRVFLMGNENGCRIAKISEGAKVEYADMAPDITCRQGVIAVGELILVIRRDSLIALR